MCFFFYDIIYWFEFKIEIYLKYISPNKNINENYYFYNYLLKIILGYYIKLQ
jgi:hypothetical protein